MTSLFVQPIAEADIDEALEWYYAIQEKLAEAGRYRAYREQFR